MLSGLLHFRPLVPVMCDACEGALGEDGVHLRTHLALRLEEVLRVPYPNLAVVAHREQSGDNKRH